MHIQADRVLIPAHSPAVAYLTITITAPGRQAPAHERPAAHVALVLDRSGSMDGQKMVMAREAVAQAIKLLNGQDELALVVYDDRIDTILERTAASAEARTTALRRLARVEARGSTDLGGGWEQGVAQLGASRRPSTALATTPSSPNGHDSPDDPRRAEAEAGAVRRVLLLTDGLANQGVVDHDELAQMAARFRAQGISTSTFGVGADFDEELLARLATEGGGHFYFIEKATQIPDFLASELGETLEIVARDVVLDLTCSTGLGAYILNGPPFEATPGRVRVPLGDMVADQEITLAIAIEFPAQLLEARCWLDCRVTDRDGVLFREPMRIEWRAADPADSARQPINEAVLVAAANILAQRIRITALSANRRGDFAEARRLIRGMIDHIHRLAPDNPEIRAIVKALNRDERVMGRRITERARKSMFFESHAVAYSRDVAGRAKRRG